MSQPYKESKVVRALNIAGRFILMNLSFLVCLLPAVIGGGLWIYFCGDLNEMNAAVTLLLYAVAWSGIMSAARFTIRKDDWFDGFKKGVVTRFFRNLIFCGVGVYFGYTAFQNTLQALTNFVNGSTDLVSDIIMLAGSGLLLLAILLFLTAMVPANLYLEGDLEKWLRNTWYLVFHAPLRVLASAALMWLPLFMLVLATMYFYFFALVFLAVYFTLASYVITILLKDPLIALKKRSEG